MTNRRIEKEGLSTYCVWPCTENAFFLTTEYKIIRENRPGWLAPPAIRETDNVREICYDISGKVSLKSKAEEKALSEKECIKIMKALCDMADRLGDYLLEPEYICYDPEYIFLDEERVYWLYTDSSERPVQERLEDLFAFFLSKVDYSREEAVQFVYRAFWLVRKQGFSPNLVRDLLKEEPLAEIDSDEGAGDREDEIYDTDEKPEEEEGVRTRGRSPIFILFLLLSIFSSCLAAGAGIYGYLYGFSGLPADLLPAGLAGAVISGGVCLVLHTVKRYRKEEEALLHPDPDSRPAGVKADQKEDPAPWSEEDPLDGSFPERDGTMILSVSMRNLPLLKSLETGEITLIKECPFYVGSDPVLNQMILIDKTISRQHAVILRGRNKKSYKIKDLGSTNGTWIQGRQVRSDMPDTLEDGSIVCFAQKKYRFIISRD